MLNIPKVSDIYRHFKGNLYQIIAIAQHSETAEQMVVYQAMYGDFRIYVRPLDMFLEPVDKVKYPTATQKMRFELVDRNDLQDKPVRAKSKPEVENVGEIKDKAVVITQVASEDKVVPTDYSEEVLEQVAPGVLMFLDAQTHQQRLEVLVSLANEIDDHMLNTMAVVLDVELSAETLEDRYEELKNCLLTMEKYERNRLY